MGEVSYHLADLWLDDSPKEVCIVHQKWIMEFGSFCLWPPPSMKLTQAKLERLLRLHTEPDKNWTRYRCFIRNSFGGFYTVVKVIVLSKNVNRRYYLTASLDNALMYYKSRNVEFSEQSATEEAEINLIPAKRVRRQPERYSPSHDRDELVDEDDHVPDTTAASVNLTARRYLQSQTHILPNAPLSLRATNGSFINMQFA